MVDSGMTSLIKVDLSDNFFEGKGAILLSQALQKQTKLTEVDLRDASLGDDGAIAVIKAIRGKGITRWVGGGGGGGLVLIPWWKQGDSIW